MASFFQKLGRAITGKARILNENPLTSETTIPNANWNERWGKRQQNAASNTSSVVGVAVEAIRGFLANPRLPDRAHDCVRDLVALIRLIRRIDEETEHKQMAMELENYVKKRVMTLRRLSKAEARALETAIQVGLDTVEIEETTEELDRRTAATSRAIAQMGVAMGAHGEEEEEEENADSINSNELMGEFMTQEALGRNTAGTRPTTAVAARNRTNSNELLAEFLAQERARTEGVQPTTTARNRTHSNEMLEQFLANEAAKAKRRKGGSRRMRLSRKKNRRLTRRRR